MSFRQMIIMQNRGIFDR